MQNSIWPARFFIFTLLLFAFGVLVFPLWDPDVYIHLRDGWYWITSGLKVGIDPFAYTLSGVSFDRIEPLFKIGIYSLWRAGGYDLLILTKALVVTATFFLFGLVLYRRWPSVAGVGGIFLAMILLPFAAVRPDSRLIQERPYVFTYLFCVCVMLILEDYRARATESKTRKKLWLIPCLVVPWANLHPGFMVLFVILGSYGLECVIRFVVQRKPADRRRILDLGAVTVASLLAGAVNPMGFMLYQYVLHHLGTPLMMQQILEWKPPTWEKVPFFFASVFFVWAVVVFSVVRRKARPADIIGLCVFTFAAWKSFRNIPLFYLMALPPLTAGIRELAEALKPIIPRVVSFNRRYGNRALIAASMALLGYLALLTNDARAFRLGQNLEQYPKNAIDWIGKHPIQGHILADTMWGGYIPWETRGRIPIFIDGRAEMYGVTLFWDYLAIVSGNPETLSLLEKYDVQAVLVRFNNEMQFFRQLWSDGGWGLVYWDHIAMLYVRRGPPNAELLEHFEYRLTDPKRLATGENDGVAPSAEELERAAREAPDSYLPQLMMADRALAHRDVAGARQAMLSIEKIAPRYTFELNLGVIARAEGKLAESETRLRRAIASADSEDHRNQAIRQLSVTLKAIPGREVMPFP